MSLLQAGVIGGGGGFQIQRSLRLRASATAYLSRTTPASGGDRDKWWLYAIGKRGLLGVIQYLHGADTVSADAVYHNASDKLCVDIAGTARLVSTQVFRDPTAHGVMLCTYDAANATAAQRLRVYYSSNGGGTFAEITAWDTDTRSGITTGTAKTMHNSIVHVIGKNPTAANGWLDAYLSGHRIGSWSGTPPIPSSFGSVDAVTGQWTPSGASSAYGASGSYAKFTDATSPTTLCYDASGNGNHWTPNNISTTAGATYDSMLDVPLGGGGGERGNYATLNPLNPSRSTLTNGNLTASGSTDLPTITPDSGTWYFERGGVAQTWTPPAAFPAGAGDYNFGQRPWQSTGPTGGQQAMHTGNLPAPTGAALAPSTALVAVTGLGSTIEAAVAAELPATDYLEVFKDRASAQLWKWRDTLRGTTLMLSSDSAAAETAYTAPTAGDAYVGYRWKAGAAVTNNAGSISSQVSANVAAGFSIVTNMGTGAVGATVGHGLGVAPSLFIQKPRSAGTSDDNLHVFHKSLGPTKALILNSTGSESSSAVWWNNTAPTSGVITVGGSGATAYTNANSIPYVTYCFAEIPGYSKFGSITMNAATDGAYFDAGFSTGLLMMKRNDSSSNWIMVDTVRQTYNVMGPELYPNLSNAEAIVTELDFTAGGIKFRNSGLTGTWIICAWSRSHFKYALAR